MSVLNPKVVDLKEDGSKVFEVEHSYTPFEKQVFVVGVNVTVLT